MKAIILAAGMGKRLRPITDTIPKCLVPIEKSTLLEHSLDNLKLFNIDEVLIVIGYLGEKIKEKIGTNYKGMNIRYVENKEYSVAGNMFSLFKTKGLIDDDAIVLESDLLYGNDAIKFLMEHPDKNVILTNKLSGSGDEVYVYVNKKDSLSNLKHPFFSLNPNIVENERIFGEWSGINKFSKDFLNASYKEAEKYYNEGNKGLYYEEIISKVSRLIPIKCILKHFFWTEIDNEEDLIKARNMFCNIKND